MTPIDVSPVTVAALRAAAILVFAGLGVPAFAGEDQPAPPAPVTFESLLKQDTLTGDWGGSRKRLEEAGIKLGVQEQSELWGNVSGGIRQGIHYNGLAIPSANFDLEKLWGIKGALIYTQFYEIHGRGPSATLVGNQQAEQQNAATRKQKLEH